MAISSKACKPDNFEPHNSLKLSFTNIQGPCSNCVECESFLESNSLGILALCDTNLDNSTDSGNSSVRGYLPLKLLQGLVSHELIAYLSIFNLFKLNELWPYYQKHVNQIILNRTTL